MLCYRDKTYCNQSAIGECVNRECWRFLSTQEEKDADALGLPISFADYSDGCGKKIEPEAP